MAAGFIRWKTLFLLAAAFGLSFSRGLAADVEFNRDIRPIFSRYCTTCHGGVKQAGGVSFVYRDQTLLAAESGAIPIVPGDTEQSEVIRRVTSSDDDERMPPQDHARGERLSAEEVDKLRAWIDAGASWGSHWAFRAPVRVSLPNVQHDSWPDQGLDRFVLAHLEAQRLSPSPEASREQWLRRVTFDLIGLPPTPAKISAFVSGAESMEQVVDRLLASPQFGERWSAMWLDLARYADTVGYERDPQREMWAYRNWLIRAFNSDMPFDDFTIRQLAGDLLPDATMDDRVATGFHRNTQTNTEGGSDDEEFRIAAVIDRVSTTWTVWQGLTFGCVQCHNHPYEPFRNEEYYGFLAMLNNTEDSDANDDFPHLVVPDNPVHWERANELDREITRLRHEINSAGKELALRESWKPLSIGSIEGPPDAKFDVRENEVRVDGTVPVGGDYLVQLESGSEPITAIRLEILPRSDDPKQWPEYGVVISHFEAHVIPARTPRPESAEASKAAESKTVRPVQLSAVFSDELTKPFDPEESLQAGEGGGGEYPRLNGPRWLVFVPEEPIRVETGSILRLRLAHQIDDDAHTKGAILYHFKLGAAHNVDWIDRIHSSEFRSLKQQWEHARQQRSAMPGHPTLVMQDRSPARARETRLFIRGSFLSKDRLVAPGVPAELPPLPAGQATRLDMARWLVSPENPLSARVFANRIWAELFGIGIVETVEDFGTTGLAPSHPALLDWLARRFQFDHAWQLKPLLRDIVLSATYRQDQRVRPELATIDPRNRLLARGPRTRLTAEMVRDQALAAAGLLSHKIGGPSVMPPQPEGVWNVVYSREKWIDAQGEDRWRRGLYTYWRRTSPYPSFMTFDAPSREVCTARRMPTNTPLQALVTMNDPVYSEAARALSRRMMSEGGSGLRDQLQWAFQLVTSESPSEFETAILIDLYQTTLRKYRSQEVLWKAMGDSPEAAARTLVVSTILNSDESLTK